jgi:hypothetical protein
MHVVVELPHREALAVARVVENMAGPAHTVGDALGCRCDLHPHELESHGLGVEGVGRGEITGGDGDVMEGHGNSFEVRHER